jgi:HD-like signal output (HDOD) protein
MHWIYYVNSLESKLIMFWNFHKKEIAQALTNNLESKFKPEQEPEHDNNVLVTRKVVDIPVSFLKTLKPISQLLNGKGMQQLKITAANFAPSSIIFNRGTEADSLIYVIKGNVHLEANNGLVQEIVGGSFKALYPLSAGRQHCMTAIAKSNVTVIYISQDVLLMERPVIAPLENKLSISEHLKDNLFFNRFYEHLIRGDLKTPSFPNVALKFQRAVQQGCDIKEITKIVNLDPVIAAKLIQVVNSPIYRLPDPITSNFNAVRRLGLQITRNLVTAFSMKNLIKCEKLLIKKHIQDTWMHSIKVSSISYILAQLTHKVDPEEALLAGLLHNIGVLPILVFADSLPEDAYRSFDIDSCVSEMHGQIGTIILEKWGFPDRLKLIPLQSTNWFENSNKDLSLIDIVLLAKYHHLLNNLSDTKLPLISTLPVFQKLNNQQLTPEMSLQIIQDAQQQISETMKIFTT